MNILVTIPQGYVRETFITKEIEMRIKSLGNVRWNESGKNWKPEELKEELKGIDICICGWGSARFDREVLEGADSLKIIAYTAGSVSGVVTEEVYRRGIKVVSGNWFFAQSLAEGTLAYILSALREIPHYNTEVQEGRWLNPVFYNEGLLDQTIGLIGFGMTAQILAEMLKPFHVEIKVFSEHKTDEVYEKYGVKRASLEEVLTTCKIISVHMAQREDTYHLLNKEMLKKIPDGRLLINTSRGSLIDEEALAEELVTGRIRAVLDVYEIEPLPLTSKLRGLRNAILMPHMGGPTVDRRKNCTSGVLDDVERYFKGEPLRYEIGMDYVNRMTR